MNFVKHVVATVPIWFSAVYLGVVGLSAPALADGVPSFAQPAVSPDGKEIAFASGGSIWTVPADGGDAHLLVTQSADVLRPLYSPDGKRLAFVSMATGNGDIYVVQLDTGALKRLTFDDANDRLDAWSADGRTIFYSTLGHNVGPGASDIYQINSKGGTPMPAVAEKYQNVFYSAPSPDGHTVAFCANGMAASQWWRHGHSHDDECEIWTSDGASHFTRLTDFGAKNLWPSYSPNGRTLYFMSDRDGAENIWSLSIVGPSANSADQPMPRPVQLTHFHDGRVLWPVLSADGKTMVFERNLGIWKLDLASGKTSEVPIHLRGVVADPGVQHATLGRDISELAVSHDARKIAFVVHGQVFAAPANGGAAFRVTQTTAIESHIAWSNDDRRLAYVSTRDGPRHIYLYDFTDRTETQLTSTAGNDSRPLFSPNDAVIAYERDGREIREMDIQSVARRKRYPSTRPFPEKLLASGLSLEKPPFDAGSTPFIWSSQGDWIAYISGGAKGFRNLNLVPSDATESPRQVSFLANAQNNSVCWTPDGASLFFGSGQRTEDFQLARVDLTPQTAKFKDDQFSDLFKDRPRMIPERIPRQSADGGDEPEGVAPPSKNLSSPTTMPSTAPSRGPASGPAPRPTSAPASTPIVPPVASSTTKPFVSTTRPTAAATPLPASSASALPPQTVPVVRPPVVRNRKTPVDFDNIEERMSLLPIGMDVDDVAMAPDGKAIAFVGTSGNRSNIYLYPIDPLIQHATPRQLTSTANGKSFLQFVADAATPGGYRIYYLEDRQIHWIGLLPGNTPTDVPVNVEFDLDFNRDKMLAFDQAWRYLDEGFHDPNFNGVDWKAVRARFEPHVAGARTALEERRLLCLMIGELNASHMQASGSGADVRQSVARLGVTFDPYEYQQWGHLRIATVLPFGPAALSGVKEGAFLLAVDGVSTARPANLDELLENKLDKEVVLTLADDSNGGNKKEVKVTAISAGTERTLGYRQWVRDNREYVKKISNGRLGYVHIADMSQQALARLNLDLDARNETYDGVVVDVRNNDGGFVNGYALDVFTRKNYLTIEPRGFPKMTGRAALGQRYLGSPTILVTNRETLSDGEDFTEGYQALGLGDTVGEPTAGWIIFTRGCGLIDGTAFRVPSETVYDHNGQPMELHPRPVNFAVSRAVNEPDQGKDSQLDEAVKQLLLKVDGKR
jgi:Tol biopolymer transport system component/C-terminal processing protease CtpA/Prc